MKYHALWAVVILGALVSAIIIKDTRDIRQQTEMDEQLRQQRQRDSQAEIRKVEAQTREMERQSIDALNKSQRDLDAARANYPR